MKYGLKQFRKDFPTERACLDFIFETLHTPECACGGSYRYREGRKQYQCGKCRAVVSPLVGTIFERSLVPLKKWFEAIISVEQGASAKDIQRMVACTYKTAHRMKRLIVFTQSAPIKTKGRLGIFVRAITVKHQR